MDPIDQPPARAILVLDPDGETRFAAGLATDPGWADRLRNRWREAGAVAVGSPVGGSTADERSVFALAVDGSRYAVVATPAGFDDARDAATGVVLLVHPADARLRALPAELNRLRAQLAAYERELSSLRERRAGLEQIVGRSAAILRLKQQIRKVAPLDVPVLLVGESGTGKELVAHALHRLGPRRDSPLVTVNAAAMPAALVESELFGYAAGAFTGAERKGRRGRIEQADEGTLFFDEIGDMPLETQVKLLRVLQDGSYQRIGGERIGRSDFRLISASNRDFQSMIDARAFRLDLFYRISAVTIHLPPLRERLEDIEPLAAQALADFAARHGTVPRRLSPSAIDFLQQAAWPGNVRQLIHAIERAAIFCEGERIEPVDFGTAADPPASRVRDADPSAPPPGSGLRSAGLPARPRPVRDATGRVEAELIRAAMQRLNGNKKRVAIELGISRSYLYKRLADLTGVAG